MQKKLRIAMCAMILGGLVPAFGEEVSSEGVTASVFETRRVEDIHYTVKTGGSLAIPREDILKAVKGAQGATDVSRLMMEPGRHGKVRIESGQFSFTPDEGFIGTALLQFVVRDEIGEMIAKVVIDVVAEQ
jgi:hypothetical protein